MIGVRKGGWIRVVDNIIDQTNEKNAAAQAEIDSISKVHIQSILGILGTQCNTNLMHVVTYLVTLEKASTLFSEMDVYLR